MAKKTIKKIKKKKPKNKVNKPTTKKVVEEIKPKTKNSTPLKKAVKKNSIKAYKAKTTKTTVIKPTSKDEKYNITALQKPIVTKKIFDKITLIRHPLTNSHEKTINKKPVNLSISEINGVGESTYLKFHQEGIKTVEDFVNAGVSKISKVLGWSEIGSLPYYLRGLSVFENRVIQIKSPKNLSQNPIYIDIETDLLQRTVWMIGIYITKTKEFIQLVANKATDEPKVIKKCLEILSDYPNTPLISYSGSRFDERLLRKRFSQENLKHDHLEFEDILIDIKASFAFPIKTYTLSDLGEFYGYNFKHPNMDGQQVAMLYTRYASDLTKFYAYEKLCEYNEDDVKSMASIVEHLYY